MKIEADSPYPSFKVTGDSGLFSSNVRVQDEAAVRRRPKERHDAKYRTGLREQGGVGSEYATSEACLYSA